MPWKEDAGQKVKGSNPCTGKGSFHANFFTVLSNNHLVQENVYFIGKSCIMD